MDFSQCQGFGRYKIPCGDGGCVKSPFQCLAFVENRVLKEEEKEQEEEEEEEEDKKEEEEQEDGHIGQKMKGTVEEEKARLRKELSAGGSAVGNKEPSVSTKKSYLTKTKMKEESEREPRKSKMRMMGEDEQDDMTEIWCDDGTKVNKTLECLNENQGGTSFMNLTIESFPLRERVFGLAYSSNLESIVQITIPATLAKINFTFICEDKLDLKEMSCEIKRSKEEGESRRLQEVEKKNDSLTFDLPLLIRFPLERPPFMQGKFILKVNEETLEEAGGTLEEMESSSFSLRKEGKIMVVGKVESREEACQTFICEFTAIFAVLVIFKTLLLGGCIYYCRVIL